MLCTCRPPFSEAKSVDIGRVATVRHIMRRVQQNGRSISSHAPRRIISTDPLQENYETKSGTEFRAFAPGFSFGTILVSHDYRVSGIL